MQPSAALAALERIQSGLDAACHVLSRFTWGTLQVQYKRTDDPITEADKAVNEELRALLLRPGEGWFSEETADDLSRLERNTVWLVDPIDGTREFIEGIPEWCVSIALIHNRRAVAGGIRNTATRQTFLGSVATGLTYNGRPCCPTARRQLRGASVLASRSEVKRGEWDRFAGAGFTMRPVGSIAYKMALVAAGLADATWTLVNKHEWDVAAGTALVESAGGVVRTIADGPLEFNTKTPLLPGLIASGPALYDEIRSMLAVSADVHFTPSST